MTVVSLEGKLMPDELTPLEIAERKVYDMAQAIAEVNRIDAKLLKLVKLGNADGGIGGISHVIRQCRNVLNEIDRRNGFSWRRPQ